MVGRRRAPMRFILLLFERMANIPKAEEVIKTRKPRRLEKSKFTAKRMAMTKMERSL